jgi:tetratricopeptide (TPR) repeat protein
MTGNKLNRSRLPGEKPVLNEPLNEKPQSRIIGRVVERVESAPVKKTDKKHTGNKRLKEGARLFCKKRWENALAELLLVDTDGLSPVERGELAYYLGLCYAKLRRFDDAIANLEQVVNTGGDLLRAYQCRMALAYIYVTTGRAKMAEFELKRLQDTGFESASLYNTLAYAAYVQRRYNEAVDLYEKALDIDRDNATALNSMGYILADRGIDPLRGLRFCRRALEHRPQSAAYLDSLGWAYYKCGEMMEARNLLRRALELAPKEKEIKEHYRIVNGGAA